MTLPTDVDVLIVGAGPAGLAAATVLAPHHTVLVLDREATAGGIPRHCGHYPFGLREFRRLMKGPDYAAALVARAQAAGARIATGVNVTALHPGPRVTVTSDAGLQEITARRVLLATGVRETSRAARLIGGEKPGGVVATGALQGMVYLEGRRPFRRPVILGTELVAFSAIMTCAHAGIRPVAMVEPNARPSARWPAALFPRLKGIPLHLSTTIAAIHGRDRVTGVTLATPTGPLDLDTDGVIVTGRFRPEATLFSTSHLARDPRTGGPVIDAMGRCSDPAYHAAGNLLRPVETAGWSWDEGRRIGQAIADDLAGQPAPAQRPITLTGDALAWVVPQAAGPGGALDRLQLRVARPVSGRLSLRVGGAEVYARAIHTLPDRRLTLPLPPGDGPVEVEVIE